MCPCPRLACLYALALTAPVGPALGIKAKELNSWQCICCSWKLEPAINTSPSLGEVGGKGRLGRLPRYSFSLVGT